MIVSESKNAAKRISNPGIKLKRSSSCIENDLINKEHRLRILNLENSPWIEQQLPVRSSDPSYKGPYLNYVKTALKEKMTQIK